ncbi:MAG: phospho-sugar mutase [Actinomycetia bacterium]|nr:phospho-sugar mutase [Actinomycetes bacterium]MCP4959336.1 phospho-sugar mutase [Actinomycetes bacterium]
MKNSNSDNPVLEPELARSIHGWAAADPDPAAGQALSDLAATRPAEAAALFERRLEFGTAGLRGPLGLGPASMNRVIVRIAASAIAGQLTDDALVGEVVIGHDARYGSSDFALDSARVFAALGFQPLLIDGPTPTPVVAHLALNRSAVAAIVVTASHNPPGDNGYKVYWNDGAQIVPPIDSSIEARMGRLPLDDSELASAETIERMSPDEAISQYLTTVLPDLAPATAPSSPTTIVYTALHGVGAPAIRAAFDAVGLVRPVEVTSQIDPDPDFSTVELPNPEEKGALDESFRTADAAGADVILANDPDADRLGVAVRTEAGWRKLTGDEIGCILADRLLSRNRGPNPVVASSIVSSPWIETIATAHNAQVRRTLTGFKWIIRSAIDEPELTFVFGYEEALGFACSRLVRDKDGVTAALEIACLVHELAADGRTLIDHLDSMIERFGVAASGQVTRRYEDEPGQMVARLDELRADPPSDLEIVETIDHLQSTPATNLLEWRIGHHADRVLLRPSGTEPKLKAYLQTSGSPEETDEVHTRLAALQQRITELL